MASGAAKCSNCNNQQQLKTSLRVPRGGSTGGKGKAVGLRQQLYGCVPFCCLIRLPSAAVVADVVAVVVVAAVDVVSSLWFLKPFTSFDL